jgi:hypothetical protein
VRRRGGAAEPREGAMARRARIRDPARGREYDLL